MFPSKATRGPSPNREMHFQNVTEKPLVCNYWFVGKFLRQTLMFALKKISLNFEQDRAMISSLYCTWSQSQKSGCFSVKFLTNLNRFSLLTSLSKGFFRRLTLLKLDFLIFENWSIQSSLKFQLIYRLRLILRPSLLDAIRSFCLHACRRSLQHQDLVLIILLFVCMYNLKFLIKKLCQFRQN